MQALGLGALGPWVLTLIDLLSIGLLSTAFVLAFPPTLMARSGDR